MRLPITIVSLTLAAALATAACTGAAASPSAPSDTEAPSADTVASLATEDTAATDTTTAPADTTGTTTAAVALVGGDVTEDEAAGLVFMREEEKLARDVYLAMYELWGLQVFDNIASSEQQHTDAVLNLIEAYGLEDPVTDDTPGVFTNPDFAALYETLVAQGSASLVDALTVGALIEDLDISDLRSWLERTDDAAIEQVYGSLLAGSENHLRAFVGQLGNQGATYEPTYLSQEDVDEILAARSGGGRGGRGSGQRRGGHDN